MARIKLAYIGGGSTRAPGTMGSIIRQTPENFSGSEVVLIDRDRERLALVLRLAQKMAREAGVDLSITATTDRRAGLTDCDAVLTSFRPGGFESRHLDESIPLKHGIIGQETQGPGGFFMALRTIAVIKQIVEEMEKVCPRARLFNYTNPINIVSEAVTHNTDIPTISLCEGSIENPKLYAAMIGLDPNKLDTVMFGLNHGSWTVRHLYDGADFMPILAEGYARLRRAGKLNTFEGRILRLAVKMGSLPNEYFQYYYYRDEILAELRAKPTTRAQDIMAEAPDYWLHYLQQSNTAEVSQLDPRRSRGGINELELAIDVIDAVFNNRREVWPVNVPNQGAITDFPDDRVVEVPGFVDRNGARPLACGSMPGPVKGLVLMLAEYQRLAAEAAWNGTRADAIRALAANPMVMSLSKAEALYTEMASAHALYLPQRLLIRK